LGDKDLRVHNPRFTRAAGHANQAIADAVAQIAEFELDASRRGARLSFLEVVCTTVGSRRRNHRICGFRW